MRKIVFSLFIFFILSSFCQAQLKSGTITYGVEIPQRSLDSIIDVFKKKMGDNTTENHTTKMLIKTFEKDHKLLPNLQLYLKFNTRVAIFESEEVMIPENMQPAMNPQITAGTKYPYYTNADTRQIIRQTKFSEKYYRIKKSFDSIPWKIGRETKTIAGYQCRKATITYYRKNTKYETVAWFTPELPFPYGPKDYGGLPGLILEVYEVNRIRRIYVRNIEFSKNALQIEAPEKGQLISSKEYQEMGRQRKKTLKERYGR